MNLEDEDTNTTSRSSEFHLFEDYSTEALPLLDDKVAGCSKEEEFETIFNNSQVGIVLVDHRRYILQANQTIASILGYSDASAIIGRNLRDFHLSEESYNNFGSFYKTKLVNNEQVKIDYQFRDCKGQPIWVSVSGSAVDKSDHPDLTKGVVWIIEDISERKKFEQELSDANKVLTSIFDNAMMAILFLKGGRVINKANNRAAEILGYDSAEELSGKSVRELHFTEKEFEDFGLTHYESLVDHRILELEYQARRKDGSSTWVAISGKAIDPHRPADLTQGVVWIFQDIDRKKKAESDLLRLSRTDSLTGIKNRRFFMELGNREVAVHKRYKKPLSLMMLDLDHFKNINDTRGHACGDRSICFFTELCSQEIRDTDILGRLGGEEFAIILLETDLEKAGVIAERIRMSLESRSGNADSSIPSMTVSIGLVAISEDEILEHALDRADSYLYKAKENGRNQVQC